MSTKVVYTTSAIASGGRDGRAATTEGSFEVKLVLSSLQFVSAQGAAKVPSSATVKATVGIGSRSDGPGFGLEVALEIAMPGVARSDAEALVERAHDVCPYSNATRNNVAVKLTIVDPNA